MKTGDSRQGDIYLLKVSELDKDSKKVGSKKRTLALGEVTGHHHELSGDVDFYETKSGQLICKVNSSATLTHEEHAHQKILKGVYQLVKQREYSLLEGVKSVSD